ncbi:hypothetical protein GCM10009863_31800 [Streptomyces axinellae]|uniref:Uncharacterized protein n=1 Tax=Streptomyces axinellae TaxID=552788 RepID=A0ABN3Q425_9ACTN
MPFMDPNLGSQPVQESGQGRTDHSSPPPSPQGPPLLSDSQQEALLDEILSVLDGPPTTAAAMEAGTPLRAERSDRWAEPQHTPAGNLLPRNSRREPQGAPPGAPSYQDRVRLGQAGGGQQQQETGRGQRQQGGGR